MPSELIGQGLDRFSVAAVLEGDGRVIDVALEVSEGKRRFTRNGKPCREIGRAHV